LNNNKINLSNVSWGHIIENYFGGKLDTDTAFWLSDKDMI
jgi:hypothetical protein